MAIEIVSFPMKHGGSFHSYVIHSHPSKFPQSPIVCFIPTSPFFARSIILNPPRFHAIKKSCFTIDTDMNINPKWSWFYPMFNIPNIYCIYFLMLKSFKEKPKDLDGELPACPPVFRNASSDRRRFGRPAAHGRHPGPAPAEAPRALGAGRAPRWSAAARHGATFRRGSDR